jgi:hypothetical protein
LRMARSRSAVSVGRPEAPSQQQNSNMFTSQPRRSCRSRQPRPRPRRHRVPARNSKRMGQKIRHLRCFPFAGRRGTRRRQGG